MQNNEIETPDTLKPGEFHPAASTAIRYVRFMINTHPYLLEAIASTALSGNRISELVHETIRRVMAYEPVSDRYILGAAWYLKEIEESDIK